METQIQAKPSNEVANINEAAAWGGGQNLTSNDIVIGKILPLQFMSDKVKEKKGEYGQFRDTVTNKMFGDLTKPFEFIPFYMEKKWIEFDIITNKAGARKREYKQIVPIVDNAALAGYNDDLPYVDAGQNIERDRCMDFYVMIPEEIATGEALPYLLSFRRTSLKAGKKLAMQMYTRNTRKGAAPAAITMLLSGKDVSNDDGSFVVQDVEAARETTQEELKECFEWYKLVRKGVTKVDMSDFHEEVKAPVRNGKINVEEGDY
jgi:hypothetical protein